MATWKKNNDGEWVLELTSYEVGKMEGIAMGYSTSDRHHHNDWSTWLKDIATTPMPKVGDKKVVGDGS